MPCPLHIKFINIKQFYMVLFKRYLQLNFCSIVTENLFQIKKSPKVFHERQHFIEASTECRYETSQFFLQKFFLWPSPAFLMIPTKKGSLQFFCQSCNKIKIKVIAIFSDITPMQFFACSVERREIFSSHEIKKTEFCFGRFVLT